ncbi:MAG: nuclear transport factor 2 family protein [Pyrinomonadaceae bacterium]|nr:nuclear transport factor 2 family protein [Pyrinomonadaceae bacterium]
MKADMKLLVKEWIDKWESGDYLNIPISDNFRHKSPYGTIEGKQPYLELVEANKEQFLGYSFEVHDEIYEEGRACIRYTGLHNDFVLEVSEWFFASGNEIEEVVAYFNVGELSEERRLSEPESRRA